MAFVRPLAVMNDPVGPRLRDGNNLEWRRRAPGVWNGPPDSGCGVRLPSLRNKQTARASGGRVLLRAQSRETRWCTVVCQVGNLVQISLNVDAIVEQKGYTLLIPLSEIIELICCLLGC